MLCIVVAFNVYITTVQLKMFNQVFNILCEPSTNTSTNTSIYTSACVKREGVIVQNQEATSTVHLAQLIGKMV